MIFFTWDGVTITDRHLRRDNNNTSLFPYLIKLKLYNIFKWLLKGKILNPALLWQHFEMTANGNIYFFLRYDEDINANLNFTFHPAGGPKETFIIQLWQGPTCNRNTGTWHNAQENWYGATFIISVSSFVRGIKKVLIRFGISDNSFQLRYFGQIDEPAGTAFIFCKAWVYI